MYFLFMLAFSIFLVGGRNGLYHQEHASVNNNSEAALDSGNKNQRGAKAMKRVNLNKAAISVSILLTATALLILQLSGGGASYSDRLQ